MTPTPDRRPILVTGTIRSGTTWVGSILGTAPGVAVIHEPFNRDHPPGTCAVAWQHQYAYVTDRCTMEVRSAVADTIRFRYRPARHLRRYENARRTAGIARDWPRWAWRHHVRRPRALLKDPIAVFSSRWIHEAFGADVLVLVRHPAAFVASYLRIGEPNRLHDLLDQPDLMDDLLAPVADDLARYAAGPRDPIGEAVTLWRAVQTAVESLAPEHGWLIRRHEDLAADPHREFAELFRLLDLDLTPTVRRRIERTTASTNPAEAPEGVLHQLQRDSYAATQAWRRRLTPAQVVRIREEAGRLGQAHYPDDRWW